MAGASPGVAGALTLRFTRQMTAILAALDETGTFVTARELHGLLGRQGQQVGLTTVYRCLRKLADTDNVDVLRTPGGETAYRRCSQEHHHHLICRSCGDVVEVNGPGAERWAEETAAAHGFSDVSHTLEISGTCAACRRG